MISKLCQPCQDVTFDEAYEMATDVPYDEE